jgi:16S rRNA (guanine(966)-N(2))-methyltransferase RsmD
MRVISGSARGKRLFSPRGEKIRPTADRVKEALFSILTSRLSSWDGISALDLFAGSGSLGIEALSRGAEHVVFCDKSPEAIKLVNSNLQHCGFLDCSSVIQGDAARVLQLLHRREVKFDLVFLDPPYEDMNGLSTVLELLAELSLISQDVIIVAETAVKADFSYPEQLLTLDDRRIYGDTAINLLTLKQDPSEA